MKKGIVYFILFFCALLVISTCDEILLKKTVTLEYLDGEMTFNPETVTLSGSLNYSIKNKQREALKEIYLIGHESVSIESITYQNEVMRFEEGIAYGFGFYRIKIPVLESGDKAGIVVRFHISGPVMDNRYILQKDNVFLDARKIWIPIPFADTSQFYYSITVNTPSDYIPVLGAALKRETIKGGLRRTVWESEIKDAYVSGNLIIGKFERYNKDNIYVYTHTPSNAEPLLNYASYTLRILTNKLDRYPLSQLHIVNTIFQYKNMTELMDGEYLGNIIQISPDLFSTQYEMTENQLLYSAIPFIPSKSPCKIFEVVAHEIAHAYLGGIVQFEEDAYLELESLTEYTALAVIANRYPKIYDKFIEGNRFQLINLHLRQQSQTVLWKFLYGVNCLHIAFYNNYDFFFKYIKMLIDKYSYTTISTKELISTSYEMNRAVFGLDYSDGPEWISGEDKIINNKGLLLWNTYSLYNVQFNESEVTLTNYSSNTVNVQKKIQFTSTFPFTLDLRVVFRNALLKTQTNYVSVPTRRGNYILLDPDQLWVAHKSVYESLETSLYDNQLNSETKNMLDNLILNINLFYAGKVLVFGYSVLSFETPDNFGWKNIYSDRNSGNYFNNSIVFIPDQIYLNGNDIYVCAYRQFNGVNVSYVVFRARRNNNRYQFIAILDPSIG